MKRGVAAIFTLVWCAGKTALAQIVLA